MFRSYRRCGDSKMYWNSEVGSSDEAAGVFHFSTEFFSERDRLSGLREILGRQMSRLEFEPLTPSVHADVTVRLLGNLSFASLDHSLLRVSRTRELLADGNDTLVFQIPSGMGHFFQLDREVAARAGDAVLASNGDRGTFTCASETTSSILINLSRRHLLPLVRDFDLALMSRIPSDTPSLQLLTRYLRLIGDVPPLAPELQQAAADHIYDLVALTLGATRDAGAIAEHRGVRAARLRETKAFVLRNLARQDLSTAMVALHLGVTPRYVHMLFEGENETFSEFVLGQRLMRSHRLMVDPRFANRSISAVAFDCGFGDLSHFNRSFRRRFGMTPTEARNGMRKP
jgi:AraC-like DNA-binding protein